MKNIKKILSPVFAAVLLFVLCLIVNAEIVTPRLVDNADLLSDFEESELIGKLDVISDRLNADVVVVTTESTDGYSPMDYADDFYDNNGYRPDGVLLLISMEERDWYISTAGIGIPAVSDSEIEYISDSFMSDLSAGNYYEAFEIFADLCCEYLSNAINEESYSYDNNNGGYIYDYDDGYYINNDGYEYNDYHVSHSISRAEKIVIKLAFSVIIGFAAAFIITAVMKGKLKSVHYQSGAGDYVKRNSLQITNSNEYFLYRNVSRTPKPKPQDNNMNHGGGSVHMSSSGTMHGGGGGKF